MDGAGVPATPLRLERGQEIVPLRLERRHEVAPLRLERAVEVPIRLLDVAAIALRPEPAAAPEASTDGPARAMVPARPATGR